MLRSNNYGRADLQDVAARARAVDEDAGVAHPVHDVLR